MTKPGNDSYHIKYLDHVVEEDIPYLPKTMRRRIKTAIETRLKIDPVGLGRPLRYSFKGHRRIRVGDFRVIYRVDPKARVVTIVYIRHRKNIYEL
jgi:mRNA interferase RelE/StbE